MANGVTDSNILSWLENNYQPPKLGNIAFKDSVLFPWFPVDEDAGGEQIVLRWKSGRSQGVGATYTQAKARADLSGLQPAKVTFDYETFYSVATLDNTAIERSQGGNLSAANVLQESINDAMEAHGEHLETFAFSDGYPSLGAIANISGSTFTVARQDIEKWEKDLEIVLAASRTTGDLRNSGASLTVTKVDRHADRLLITCNAGIVATIGAAANGDHAFIKSTRVDGAARQCLVGIGGYIPDTAVSVSDAFGDGSFNRSVEPMRMAGCRVAIDAGSSTRQGLIDAVVQWGKYNVNPDALFMSHERQGDLIKELGNNVRYVDMEVKRYGLNITGVKLVTKSGEIPCFASAKCPNANVYGLRRRSWKLFSVNGAPIRPATRYQKALDSATTDGIELRYRSFLQLGCLRPWENGVAVFA